MATIKLVIEAIRLTREAKISLFLWSEHGCGKSSVVAQTAESMGLGFWIFDVHKSRRSTCAVCRKKRRTVQHDSCRLTSCRNLAKASCFLTN
jgi:hypothetical protein